MARKLTAGILILLYMVATIGMAVHKCHCDHSDTLVLFNSESCVCEHSHSCEETDMQHPTFTEDNCCNTEYKKADFDVESYSLGENFLPFITAYTIVNFTMPEELSFIKTLHKASPLILYEKSGIYLHCQLRL